MNTPINLGELIQEFAGVIGGATIIGVWFANSVKKHSKEQSEESEKRFNAKFDEFVNSAKERFDNIDKNIENVGREVEKVDGKVQRIFDDLNMVMETENVLLEHALTDNATGKIEKQHEIFTKHLIQSR